MLFSTWKQISSFLNGRLWLETRIVSVTLSLGLIKPSSITQ